MVHVMSEVKPFYAAPVTNDMSHDHNYSLCYFAKDFDAQRLRADTAEAEIIRLQEAATLAAKVGAPNFHSMKRELAAAEQRIAELGEQRKIAEQEVIVATGLLRRAASEIDSLASSLENACEDFEGEDDEDPQASGEVEDARSLANRIRAALNPNPEAESQ